MNIGSFLLSSLPPPSSPLLSSTDTFSAMRFYRRRPLRCSSSSSYLVQHLYSTTQLPSSPLTNVNIQGVQPSPSHFKQHHQQRIRRNPIWTSLCISEWNLCSSQHGQGGQTRKCWSDASSGSFSLSPLLLLPVPSFPPSLFFSPPHSLPTPCFLPSPAAPKPDPNEAARAHPSRSPRSADPRSAVGARNKSQGTLRGRGSFG